MVFRWNEQKQIQQTYELTELLELGVPVLRKKRAGYALLSFAQRGKRISASIPNASGRADGRIQKKFVVESSNELYKGKSFETKICAQAARQPGTYTANILSCMQGGEATSPCKLFLEALQIK